MTICSRCGTEHSSTTCPVCGANSENRPYGVLAPHDRHKAEVHKNPSPSQNIQLQPRDPTASFFSELRANKKDSWLRALRKTRKGR